MIGPAAIAPLLAQALTPAGLGVVALAALAAGLRRLGLWAFAALLVSGVPVVATLLLSLLPLRAGPDGAPPGAIVVLPDASPELVNPGSAEPGGNALERLRTAAALARRTALPILLTGGLQPDGRTPQAVAMAASLHEDFQLTARWTEAGSQNIWQSTAASAALLRASGVDGIYLVADIWEQPLAAQIYRRDGLDVTLAPVTRPKQRFRIDEGWLIGAMTWLESEWALRQWAGLACDAVPPCREVMSRP